MLWAMSEDGQRLQAWPGIRRALCPTCRGPVLAKCGPIVAWHWAHEAADCDPWSEPESAWHRGWKLRFPAAWQEVALGPHRADIRTPHLVVELQASALAVEDIQAREAFYGRMVWVLDGRPFLDHLTITHPAGWRADAVRFRWKWPRKSWWHAQRQVLSDTGRDLLAIRKVLRTTPCGGWGIRVPYDAFIRRCTHGRSRIASAPRRDEPSPVPHTPAEAAQCRAWQAH